MFDNALIELFESRTLFATVFGTPNADTVYIYNGANVRDLVININGTVTINRDFSNTIDLLGGGDTVYVQELRRIDSDRNLLVLLGDGNDYLTTYDPTNSGGSIRFLQFQLTVHGGLGQDLLALDDSAGNCDYYNFGPNYTIDHDSFAVFTQQIIYDAGMEEITLDAADVNDFVGLQWKPDLMRLTVNSSDGDDQIVVGHLSRDIDSSGFRTSTTTLVGGLGNDSLVFDDRSDESQTGVTEFYNFNNNLFIKGNANASYFTFEQQYLKVADDIASGPTTVTSINAIGGGIASTTVFGGSLRSSIVNISSGNVAGLTGGININGGAARCQIYYNDQSSSGDKQYLVSATQVARTGGPAVPVNFSNIDTIHVNAGTGNDQIVVEGVAAQSTVNANGGNGNDLIVVGNFGSYFTTLLGLVNATGGAGTDEMRWISFDTQPVPAQLYSTGLALNNRLYSAASMEKHSVNFFNTTLLDLNVVSTSTPTSITGGNGNDHITVGNGNYSLNIQQHITINGGNGDDTVEIDDDAHADASSYALTTGDYFYKPITQGFEWSTDSNNVEHLSINTGGGNDGITVHANTIDVSISSGPGDDIVNIFDSTIPVTIDTGTESGTGVFFQGDFITVNTDAANAGDVSAAVRIAANDKLWGMNVVSSVTSSGLLRIEAGRTINLTNTLNLTGTIDLAGGSLLVRPAAATQAALRQLIARGYANGNWNGTSISGAINNSLASGSPAADAVGYAAGSEVAITQIGGFAILASDTLVRHAYYGDADLNGVVDFDDYVHIDLGFNTDRTGWINGDFNYGGDIEFDDYVLIDLAFNTQG